MNRYASPINPAVFPHLTVVLLSIGIFFMAWFFVYPFKCSLHKFAYDSYCKLIEIFSGNQFINLTVHVYVELIFELMWFESPNNCARSFPYFFNDYCSYEVTSTKYSRDIYKELLVSLVASLFMGFGVLFLLLWVGIYV
ncbi:unnamed protein product [Pocillopora meandrina]|uniref:Dolichyl-diphosphooligosaccharide-protein glycosyltransferase subunit TMEM258 n=1 Tax=Pocillopora meandrina TaxID=46732 RepID=A0AAU9XDX6_9CNID|nr:unnamed protein product [Pocillopora meandrina]